MPTGEGGVEDSASNSAAPSGSLSARRITFADQHGHNLDHVHYVEHLHYSAGADHSQSDEWDSDASRCVIS